MNSYESWFARQLKARIEQEITDRSGAILDGIVPDMADYKGRTQYLKALKHTLDWCDEIAAKISEDERNDR